MIQFGNKVKLTESQLHRVIKESVKRVLNEMIGNSSPNGYQFDYKNGYVQRNQGGAFGGNSLDIARDRDKYEKEQAAKRAYNNCSDDVNRWYNQHYYDVVADFPGASSMTKQEVYNRFHSMY